MTQEALIPRMKRIDKSNNRLKIPFLSILFIVLALFMIIGSTFIGVDIKHYFLPRGAFFNNALTKEDYIFTFYIIPQIPILMFVCSTLGKKLATISVVLYLFLGFFMFPLFALGGGITYFSEYGCGYLLAYLPAVGIVTSFLHKKYSFLYMFLAVLCGVLIIHFGGIVYMSLIALLKHEGANFIFSWIEAQSGLKIFYDIISSFILVLIGKYINVFVRFLLD